MPKKFYTSKTFWVNILAIAGILYQSFTGNDILNTEAQVAILAVINIILRIITKSPIVW